MEEERTCLLYCNLKVADNLKISECLLFLLFKTDHKETGFVLAEDSF
jgi:hypothetical protein